MATLNFNQDQCILCGQCVEKCPFGALEILDNKIEINASCKMCKLCEIMSGTGSFAGRG